MGIAMLGFGSQTIYNTKANLSMQKDLIFSSMINEIQTASSNNVICTAALIGTTPAAGTGVAMNTPSNTFSAGSEYQIHWVKFSSRRCSGPRLYHSQTR
jgi:hypothetical protein